MIKYLVRHDNSTLEFSTLEAADTYRTENAILGAAEQFDEPSADVVPFDYVDLVTRAKAHGQSVAIRFAAENVAMGISQLGKTKLIADTLRDVAYYLDSGSLKEALIAADQIILTPEMSPFLTPARVVNVKQQISAFFGV